VFLVTPVTNGVMTYPYTLGSMIIEYTIRFYHRQTLPGSVSGRQLGVLQFYSNGTSSTNFWFGPVGFSPSDSLRNYVDMSSYTKTTGTDLTVQNTPDTLGLVLYPGSYILCMQSNCGLTQTTTSGVTTLVSTMTLGAAVTVMNTPTPMSANPMFSACYLQNTSASNALVFAKNDFTQPLSYYACVNVAAGTFTARTITFSIAATGTGAVYTTPTTGKAQSTFVITPIARPTYGGFAVSNNKTTDIRGTVQDIAPRGDRKGSKSDIDGRVDVDDPTVVSRRFIAEELNAHARRVVDEGYVSVNASDTRAPLQPRVESVAARALSPPRVGAGGLSR